MWILNETPSNLCFKYLQQRRNHLPWPHIHVITTWLLANSSSYRVNICLPPCHNLIQELPCQKQCLNYSTGPFSKGFTVCQLGPGTIGTTWTKTNSSHESQTPLLLTLTRNINSTWCLLLKSSLLNQILYSLMWLAESRSHGPQCKRIQERKTVNSTLGRQKS